MRLRGTPGRGNEVDADPPPAACRSRPRPEENMLADLKRAIARGEIVIVLTPNRPASGHARPRATPGREPERTKPAVCPLLNQPGIREIAAPMHFPGSGFEPGWPCHSGLRRTG